MKATPREVKSFFKRLERLLEEAEPALQWGHHKPELSTEAGLLLRQIDDILENYDDETAGRKQPPEQPRRPPRGDRELSMRRSKKVHTENSR